MLSLGINRWMENAVFLTLQHPRLKDISRSGFTAFAGIAASLHPLPADAACCSGPWGSGPCDPGDCSADTCAGKTHGIAGFCYTPSSNCWVSEECGGRCCDCEWVYDDGTVYQYYYCWCH